MMDFHMSAGFIGEDMLPTKYCGAKLEVTSNCDKVVLVGKFYKIMRSKLLEKHDFDVAITFNNYLNMMKVHKNLCIIVENEANSLLFKRKITHNDICDGVQLLKECEFEFIGPMFINMVTNYTPIPELNIAYADTNGKVYYHCDYSVCKEVDKITIFKDGKQKDTKNYILVAGDYSYLPIEVIAVKKSNNNFNVKMTIERNGTLTKLDVTA